MLLNLRIQHLLPLSNQQQIERYCTMQTEKKTEPEREGEREGRGGGGERERKRQTDRQANRQADRQRQRQRDRNRDRRTHRQRETDRQTGKQTGRQTETETKRQKQKSPCHYQPTWLQFDLFVLFNQNHWCQCRSLSHLHWSHVPLSLAPSFSDTEDTPRQLRSAALPLLPHLHRQWLRSAW